MPKALLKKVGHALSLAREVLSHQAPLTRLVLRAQVPPISYFWPYLIDPFNSRQ